MFLILVSRMYSNCNQHKKYCAQFNSPSLKRNKAQKSYVVFSLNSETKANDKSRIVKYKASVYRNTLPDNGNASHT